MLPSEINTIITNFQLTENAVRASRWGEGHIHETYLVETKDHQPDYILQKLNQNVFRNIPGMMENIEAITRHFRKKLTTMPGHNPGAEALTLVLY